MMLSSCRALTDVQKMLLGSFLSCFSAVMTAMRGIETMKSLLTTFHASLILLISSFAVRESSTLSCSTSGRIVANFSVLLTKTFIEPLKVNSVFDPGATTIASMFPNFRSLLTFLSFWFSLLYMTGLNMSLCSGWLSAVAIMSPATPADCSIPMFIILFVIEEEGVGVFFLF